MSAIVKTKALVIRKNEFGDSSYVVTLFTEEFGKFSAVIKGARSSKNKNVLSADVLNYVNVVMYKKEHRETQLVTQVDLINGYKRIKESLNKLKYAIAVCELIQDLLLDNEPHKRLFKGVLRIFELMELNNQSHKLLFVKFLIFFIEEIGFKLNLDTCVVCDKELSNQANYGFNYEKGFLCEACAAENFVNRIFDSELFNLLLCLSTKKNQVKYSDTSLDSLINFLELYLSFHVQEFKGIKSLKIY